jgi:hypothetical protein
MKESVFRASIIKACRHEVLHAVCTEVPTDPGWPDITILRLEQPIFIECKMYKSPYFWKHFQPSQLNWYNDYFKFGGSELYVAMYIERGKIFFIKITYSIFKDIKFKLPKDDIGYKSNYVEISKWLKLRS